MKFPVTIKYKKLHDNAVIPEYQSYGAACVDLVATEIEYLDENKVIVHFGFATEIPHGYKVVMQPRSSFTHKSWFMANTPGQVDSDYRGEWIAKFEAIPVGVKEEKLLYEEFPFKPGDRVVQIYIEQCIRVQFRVVNDLSETWRGEGGFGSTGKK